MLITVMSQLSNGPYTNFTKFVLFIKMHLPSSLVYMLGLLKMIVHAVMIELD